MKKNGVLATLPSDLALALCDPDEDEGGPRGLRQELLRVQVRGAVRRLRGDLEPDEPPTHRHQLVRHADEVRRRGRSWPPLQDEINARKKRVDEVASEAKLPADKVERLAAIAASRAYEIHLDKKADLTEEERKEVEGAAQMSTKVIRLLLPFFDSAHARRRLQQKSK